MNNEYSNDRNLFSKNYHKITCKGTVLNQSLQLGKLVRFIFKAAEIQIIKKKKLFKLNFEMEVQISMNDHCKMVPDFLLCIRFKYTLSNTACGVMAVLLACGVMVSK